MIYVKDLDCGKSVGSLFSYLNINFDFSIVNFHLFFDNYKLTFFGKFWFLFVFGDEQGRKFGMCNV